MTVYVDNARIPYGRMIMCHMVADSEAELHLMAQCIGVQRRWYHRGHYNICLKMRAEALACGAKEASRRAVATLRRKLEGDGGAQFFRSPTSFPPRQPRRKVKTSSTTNHPRCPAYPQEGTRGERHQTHHRERGRNRDRRAPEILHRSRARKGGQRVHAEDHGRAGAAQRR
jgi:hypothetical protein